MRSLPAGGGVGSRVSCPALGHPPGTGRAMPGMCLGLRSDQASLASMSPHSHSSRASALSSQAAGLCALLSDGLGVRC